MRLSEYISTNNLTDAEFGARTGLSQSQVNRIKHGASRPSWDSLAAIERETGGAVSAADFLPPAGDNSEPERAA